MVSTYCLVKLFKKATYRRNRKKLDGKRDVSSGEVRSGTSGAATAGTSVAGTCTASSTNTSRSKLNTKTNKCRVCLQEGTIPIFSENESSDLSEAVCTFSDIKMSEDDKYPKHLCDACLSLLKGAILFRKTAKKSYQILKSIHEPPAVSQINNVKKIKQEKKPEKLKQTVFQKYFSIVDQYNTNTTDTLTAKNKKKSSRVQCRICFKILAKSYYREHFVLHDPNSSKYVCDVCGKSFRQRCAYRNHFFTHSTEFPYKCKVCPYRARHSGLLKTHLRTHTGDYRYMCTECPARFLTKSNLNRHTLKHKEPTFKCDNCQRAFHSKLILERHFAADHLGIKNHICNLCGKAFGYRKAMMRHQLDVHKREKKSNGRTPSYLEVQNGTQGE